MTKNISNNSLNRLPLYLRILIQLKNEGNEYVNSKTLASYMGTNDEQVKKDLQIVSNKPGKPKIGRSIDELITDIEEFLGYNEESDAIIIGTGKLGNALLNYSGFPAQGINIVAGFDNDPQKIGKKVNGKMIYDIRNIDFILPKINAKIAIITTPASVAAEVANILVEAGIKAIWNFSQAILVLNDVIVENVDLASSLAVLSHRLKEKEKNNEN